MSQKKATPPWSGAASRITVQLAGKNSFDTTENTINPQDIAVARIAARCRVSISVARVISELSGYGVAA